MPVDVGLVIGIGIGFFVLGFFTGAVVTFLNHKLAVKAYADFNQAVNDIAKVKAAIAPVSTAAPVPVVAAPAPTTSVDAAVSALQAATAAVSALQTGQVSAQ